MKTELRITTDVITNTSFYLWKEALNETDFKFYLESDNAYFSLPIENKFSKDDFKNSKTISAKGYSQGDFINYKIYFNGELPNYIETLLKHTFTRKNDYQCELYQYTEINGKKYFAENFHDITTLSIMNIEFPTQEEIIKEYKDLYGENYNSIKIDLL